VYACMRADGGHCYAERLGLIFDALYRVHA